MHPCRRRHGEPAAVDLADGAGIERIGPSIFARCGRLDILVVDAGVLGKRTPVPHMMDADWAEVVSVNLTGGRRLIRLCDPLLRRAETGPGDLRGGSDGGGAARRLGRVWLH